jgi:hypothetical protein
MYFRHGNGIIIASGDEGVKGFSNLTPFVPLSLRGRVKERGRKKEEGSAPLLDAPLCYRANAPLYAG